MPSGRVEIRPDQIAGIGNITEQIIAGLFVECPLNAAIDVIAVEQGLTAGSTSKIYQPVLTLLEIPRPFLHFLLAVAVDYLISIV